MRLHHKNEHRADCYSVEMVKDGTWKSAWAYPELKFGDTLGRKGGLHMWHMYCCNDTNCPAQLWVMQDDILELLPKE